MKQTMAIIGATEQKGKAAIMQLASHPGLRFLLLSPDTAALELLTQSLQQKFPDAEIEPMTCTRDASWEADIILLTVPDAEQEMVAKLIREVVTGKVVIHVKENESTAGLHSLLPHSVVLETKLDGLEQLYRTKCK